MARSSNSEVEKRSDSTAWSELLHWIERFRAAPNFEVDERTYKLEAAGRVATAREHFQSGTAGWEGRLREAFNRDRKPALVDFRSKDDFLKWVDLWVDPTSAQCRGALQALWSAEGPPEERLQNFCDHVPADVLGALGERLNVGTFLLMAEDVTRLPPVKVSPFQKVWKLADRVSWTIWFGTAGVGQPPCVIVLTHRAPFGLWQSETTTRENGRRRIGTHSPPGARMK